MLRLRLRRELAPLPPRVCLSVTSRCSSKTNNCIIIMLPMPQGGSVEMGQLGANSAQGQLDARDSARGHFGAAPCLSTLRILTWRRPGVTVT